MCKCPPSKCLQITAMKFVIRQKNDTKWKSSRAYAVLRQNWKQRERFFPCIATPPKISTASAYNHCGCLYSFTDDLNQTLSFLLPGFFTSLVNVMNFPLTSCWGITKILTHLSSCSQKKICSSHLKNNVVFALKPTVKFECLAPS